MKKQKILKALLICIIIILLVIATITTYDWITINKKYYISEREIYIPIFVYHDIVNKESEIEFDYMQTTEKRYESQISGLLELGYDFITFEDLKAYKENKIPLRKKSCIVTFDDGYEGVYENAYPISKKYNVPITMFVVTDNIGTQGIITWNEAKEMKESGLVTIASHSTNHTDFSKLSKEEALNNVNDSYKAMEEHLNKDEIKIFTYPYGLHNEEQNDYLWKSGYVQNLTDNKINESKNIDLSRLHRSYPLSDSIFKMILKMHYRVLRYN